MEKSNDSYEYVLYVDEAGDDGLKKVRPIDPDGSSEWLCIGALLVRVNNEKSVVDWVKDIRRDIAAIQGPVLHFRDLSPTKRLRACAMVADLPARGFVVCSNKKNMRGYNNERAAERGGKQWYYNFCVRLLMERVTELCHDDSVDKYGAPRTVKVVFSKRGGHSYGQTKAYWELLKNQAAGGTTFLNKREIKHQVLRFGLVDYVPHYQDAGLQLADVIASAFFQGVETSGMKWDPAPAQALTKVMFKKRSIVADHGVVLMPSVAKARLSVEQQQLFLHYGYRFEGVGPGL